MSFFRGIINKFIGTSPDKSQQEEQKAPQDIGGSNENETMKNDEKIEMSFDDGNDDGSDLTNSPVIFTRQGLKKSVDLNKYLKRSRRMNKLFRKAVQSYKKELKKNNQQQSVKNRCINIEDLTVNTILAQCFQVLEVVWQSASYKQKRQCVKQAYQVLNNPEPQQQAVSRDLALGSEDMQKSSSLIKEYFQECCIVDYTMKEAESFDNSVSYDSSHESFVTCKDELIDIKPEDDPLSFENIQQKGVPYAILELIKLSEGQLIDKLNQIKTASLQHYTEICELSSFFEQNEGYILAKASIVTYYQKQLMEKCNKCLMQFYNSNNHAGYQLYLKLKAEGKVLADPILLTLELTTAKEFLLSFQPLANCQQLFNELRQMISLNDSEEVVNALQEIMVVDENCYNSISSQVFILCPNARQKADQLYKYFKFEQQIPQQNKQNPLIQEFLALIKASNYAKATQSLDCISQENSEVALYLHQVTVQAYYEFLEHYPLQRLIKTSSKPNLRIQVEQLIEILNKANSQEAQGNINNIVERLFKQIYLEDQVYFQSMHKQLSQIFPFINIYEYPMTPSQINIQSLTQISGLIDNLERKLAIKDFMSLEADFDANQKEMKLVQTYQETGKINNHQLVTLLFDYIKRRRDFQWIINLLVKTVINGQNENYCKKLTKQVLLNYLLKNSDQYLRTLLIMACANFMPIPLLSFEWKDECKSVLLWQETFYCFEKQKAIFTFKLSSNLSKGPIGCTSIINSVTSRDFEQHNDSLTSFGSIDLYFDYNFSTPLYVPIADAHGYLESDVLFQVYPLFDIFIIHILNNQEDKVLMHEHLNYLNQIKPQAKVIVLIHDMTEGIGNQEPVLQIIQNQYTKQIRPYQSMLDQDKQNLKNELYEIIKADITALNDYQGDYQRRLNSLLDYTEFLKRFNQDPQQLIQGIQVIENFIQKIKENVDNLHSEAFLPMNFYFQQLCLITEELQRESDMDQYNRDRLTNEKENLKKKLKDCPESTVIRDLMEVIEFPNFLGISSIIAKLVKAYLENELKPLFNERGKLRSEIQNDQLTKDQKESILNQINDLSKSIEKRWFSTEYVYRELYLLSQNDRRSYLNPYMGIVNSQIEQGQPFEIIDGNNLSFISNIFEKKYENDDDQVLVVSVIGPQSSGKSLLLNFLFGIQFQSAAGRCTKGIYASLLHLKDDPKLKYKKILLLDTEGIQAAEGRDERFDKRIVFYILCVSQVVLICNKGEMNSTMTEILKLATECMSTLRQQIIQGQSVNIVMNMLAQTDENALENSIQKLSSAIIEIDNEQERRKLFHITRENVFLLPFAFDRSGQEHMVVNKPSQEFSLKLEPLRKKILNQQSIDQDQYTLSSWFRFAQDFWHFSSTFQGIIDYDNIDQKRQDQSLTERIKYLIEKYFESNQEENHKRIDQWLTEIKTRHLTAGFIHISRIQDEAKQKIFDHHQGIKRQIEDEYQKFCGDENIPTILKDKRKGMLIRQIIFYEQEWYNYAIHNLAEFRDKKSKLVGDSKIQSFLDDAMRQKDIYTVEEAEQIFEKAWQESVDDVTRMLPVEQQVKEEVFQLVGNFYKAEMLGKRIQDFQLEKEILQHFQDKGTSALTDYINTNKESFMFFNGTEVRPNQQKINQIQDKPQDYLILKDKLFVVRKFDRIYNWKQFLKECFDFDALIKRLHLILNPNIGSGGKRIINSIFSSKKQEVSQLYNLCYDVESECQSFDLKLTREFKTQITDIITYLEQLGQPMKLNVSNDLKQLLEIFIEEMKCTIPEFFQYEERNSFKKTSAFAFFKVNQNQNQKMYRSQNSRIVSYKCSNAHYFELIETRENKMDIQYRGVQTLERNKELVIINPEIQKSFVNNKRLLTYFKYLQEPNQHQFNDQVPECIQGKIYFFEHMHWKRIIEEIEKIVLENYKCFDKVGKKETIDYWIKLLRSKDRQEHKTKFCPLKQKVVQSTARFINQLINSIDEVLEPFCFKISEKGAQVLHLVAQTYITGLAQELQLLERSSPLDIQQASKDLQRKMFIAKLTSDERGKDTTLACKISNNLFKQLFENTKTKAIMSFRSIMLLEKAKFKKNKLIERIETYAINQAQSQQIQGNDEDLFDNLDDSDDEDEICQINTCQRDPQSRAPEKRINHKEENKGEDIEMQRIDVDLNVNLKEVIDFYIDPKSLLYKKFNEQWNSIVPEYLMQQKEYMKEEMNIYLCQICLYLQEFKDKLTFKKSDIKSEAIFISKAAMDNFKKLESNQKFEKKKEPKNFQEKEKNLFQKAAAQYFTQMILRKWKHELAMKIDNQDIQNLPERDLPQPEELKNNLSQAIIDTIVDSLKDEQISRLGFFAEEFLREIQKMFINLQLPSDDEMIGDMLQDFKNEFIGCQEHCPLCRRQCDVPHKEAEALAERIHQCKEGHQLQGFGGNRQYGTNDAITVSCSDLKDSDEVYHQQTTIKWADFKQRFKFWRFDQSQNVQINKEKNMKVWNFIGRHICETYQKEKNIQINYVPASLNKIQKVHYILLLDSSGSMQFENRWANLMTSVSEFLKALTSNLNLKRFSRVSAMTYTTDVQKVFYKKIAELELADQIKFIGGGTNFSKPLEAAKIWIEKSLRKFDKIVLCFLSDGEAAYPNEIIKQYQDSKDIMSKMEFTGIGYGQEHLFRQSLEPMAKALNGKMKTAIEPKELINLFIKLIPNPYEE